MFSVQYTHVYSSGINWWNLLIQKHLSQSDRDWYLVVWLAKMYCLIWAFLGFFNIGGIQIFKKSYFYFNAVKFAWVVTVMSP